MPEPLLQIGVSVKNQYRMTNSVDADEPSHQDLHCLEKKIVLSVGLRGLKSPKRLNRIQDKMSTTKKWVAGQNSPCKMLHSASMLLNGDSIKEKSH